MILPKSDNQIHCGILVDGQLHDFQSLLKSIRFYHHEKQ
jgi:hypothetical protein